MNSTLFGYILNAILANENRSMATVDSHIHFTHRKDNDSNKIKCHLNVYELNGKVIE